MSETALAMLAVQRATYALLNGALTDPIGGAVVPVYDQVPETTAFPYVQLSASTETPRNTFNHAGRMVLHQINVWCRSGSDAASDGWYQPRGIAAQIDELLDGALPAASDGWTFILCQMESIKESVGLDGMTRRVLMEYQLLLELT